jgi:membrane peptidoglycan carboxypeptidase
MRPSTADAVNDVLRGVVEPGGLASAQALDQPAAGKTGNDKGLSVWFVGCTPQLAAADMIAGADASGSPRELDGTTVRGFPSTALPRPPMPRPSGGDAIRRIDDWLDDRDFRYPRGVPGAGAVRPDLPTSASRDAPATVGEVR